MAIYVDEPRWQHRGEPAAHLFGAPLDALHTFAREIGLGNDDFNAHAVLPHYRIVAALIPAACAAGAVAVGHGEERLRRAAQTRDAIAGDAPAPRRTPAPRERRSMPAPPAARSPNTIAQGSLF
jgi:hypothetical protein